MLKHWIIGFFGAMLLLAGVAPAMAQQGQAAPARPKLGILEIKPTPALRAKVGQQRGGGSLSLDRVTQSMDGQLLDRLFQIRRYDLVARSDLETLLKEQDLQQAFAANPVEAFRMAGCDFGLIVTLDDFDDSEEQLRGEGGQVLAVRRTVRMSAVARIYDVQRGVLVATANLQIGPMTDSQRPQTGVGGGSGDQFGEMLVRMSREFASQAAIAVLDATLPARVVSVRGSQVGINRGEGTGIEPGQEWIIYTGEGEPIIDPDTGEVLGVEEVAIGRVVIERVDERLAWGRATEDFGIAVRAIARRASPR